MSSAMAVCYAFSRVRRILVSALPIHILKLPNPIAVRDARAIQIIIKKEKRAFVI